jgi:hypothetical protein
MTEYSQKGHEKIDEKPLPDSQCDLALWASSLTFLCFWKADQCPGRHQPNEDATRVNQPPFKGVDF